MSCGTQREPEPNESCASEQHEHEIQPGEGKGSAAGLRRGSRGGLWDNLGGRCRRTQRIGAAVLRLAGGLCERSGRPDRCDG